MLTKVIISKSVAESNNDELIGFIGARFEAMADRFNAIEERMVTKAHHDASIAAVRGDIEQVQLRLDSMEHGITSRFERGR